MLIYLPKKAKLILSLCWCFMRIHIFLNLIFLISIQPNIYLFILEQASRGHSTFHLARKFPPLSVLSSNSMWVGADLWFITLYMPCLLLKYAFRPFQKVEDDIYIRGYLKVIILLNLRWSLWPLACRHNTIKLVWHYYVTGKIRWHDGSGMIRNH